MHGIAAALGLLEATVAPACTVLDQPQEPAREISAAMILRRKKAWALRMRGQSTYKIGEALGVDHSTIVRDLAAMNELRRTDRAAMAATAEAQKEEAKGRYELVIEEAMTEWERGKADKQRQSAKETSAKGGQGAGAEPTKVETQAATEGRLADSQYLKVVVSAQKEIDALDGLVKTKHEHTIPGMVQMVITEEIIGDGSSSQDDRPAPGTESVPR